jgi:hypothetical protein
MSYSDYGGFVWKRAGTGLWERQCGNEDASIQNLLLGVLAPTDKPMLQATGLKFDVLLAAQPDYGKDDGGTRDQYFLEHAHHAIFGDNHVMVVMHKCGVMGLRVEGKIVFNDSDGEVYNKDFGDAIHNLPEGYKFLYYDEWLIPGNGVVARLVTPSCEWMAVTGYGWGDGHFWQNEQRQEVDYETKKVEKPWVRWPTPEEALYVVEKSTDCIKEMER